MLFLRLVSVGVMACTILALGVADGEPLQPTGGSRTIRQAASPTATSRMPTRVTGGWRSIPKTEPDRVGTDLKQAIRCLRSSAASRKSTRSAKR